MSVLTKQESTSRCTKLIKRYWEKRNGVKFNFKQEIHCWLACLNCLIKEISLRQSATPDTTQPFHFGNAHSSGITLKVVDLHHSPRESSFAKYDVESYNMADSSQYSQGLRSQSQVHLQAQRVLRAKYHTLKNDLDNNSELITTGGKKGRNYLNSIIVSSDRLAESLENAAVVKDDAEVVLKSAELHLKTSMNARSSSADLPLEEYASCIAKRCEEERQKHGMASEDTPLEWLGNLVFQKSRRAPTLDFLLGPLDIQKRAVSGSSGTRLRFDEQLSAAPVAVSADDTEQYQSQTTEMIQDIYATLMDAVEEEGGPVFLFEFILNPKSFVQSVENLFYVSFLVKDGKASIDLDESGVPTISVVDPATSMGGSQTRHQLIFDLDVGSWRELCDLFELEEPIIPHREYTTNAFGMTVTS